MRNIGETDQVVRVGLASIFVILAVALQGYAWLLVIPSAVLYFTASVRYCPLYAPFHINTNGTTRSRI